MNQNQPVSLPFIITTSGILVVLLVGIADYLLGPELATSLFYLVPIYLVTWFVGQKKAGIVVALASALSWFAVEGLTNKELSSVFVLYWNAATRLVIFTTTSLLVAGWRKSLLHERELSRVDYLTGALNGRAFNEVAHNEISRAARYGHHFSLAYIDLDDFKAFNDAHGHTLGDALLRTIVEIVQANLRKSDVVARVGGDEFVLLLPETGEAGAQAAVAKIRAEVLSGLGARDWHVTISSGVVTFTQPPADVDAMIKCADNLMYQVKNTGKNAVRYSVCSELSHEGN